MPSTSNMIDSAPIFEIEKINNLLRKTFRIEILGETIFFSWFRSSYK